MVEAPPTGISKVRILLMAWILLALWAGMGFLPGSAVAAELVVVVAGDLRGEIKPCGCSPEGQLGGLPRRLSYLQSLRSAAADAPLVLDLGNNFPEPSPQGLLKMALIQELLLAMAPDALLPGPNELAMGLAALDKRLPFVLSNDQLGNAFAPRRTVSRAAGSVAIFGYLSPDLVYQKSQQNFRLLPASGVLVEQWRNMRNKANAAKNLLLFRGGDAELALLAGSGLFQAIIVGNPHADENNQVVKRVVGGKTFPQVPTKGQGLIRLDFGDRPTALPPNWRVDWLDESHADHPLAVKVFADYDAQVKGLFFARLDILKQARQESPFAGAKSCADCHQASQVVWSASGHAHALATLERVGKQFDPECLACHVVGLEQKGFLSKDLTPDLANVQCENCHGPARNHAATPTTVKTGAQPGAVHGTATRPTEKTCRICHRGSHSPTFNFATYWPKIMHR